MKKLWFLLLFGVIFLTQCAPDEQLKLVKDGKLQPRTCYAFSISEVLYIGSHHNSFLSEITGEFYCAAENREADAINAFETFGENEEISSGIIENAVTNMYTTTFDIGDYSGDFDDYSDVATLYGDIVLAIINNDDYDDVSDALDDVRSDADIELSCFDWSFIASTVEVARNSAYFWYPTENNGAGNEPVCDGWPEGRDESHSFWEKLAMHDLAGAATAFMEYGIGLAIPGANVEIAGAIAAHAAWHSAIGAYLDLW